jgi:hypothetical protein
LHPELERVKTESERRAETVERDINNTVEFCYYNNNTVELLKEIMHVAWLSLKEAKSFDVITCYLTWKHGGNVHGKGIVTIAYSVETLGEIWFKHYSESKIMAFTETLKLDRICVREFAQGKDRKSVV